MSYHWLPLEHSRVICLIETWAGLAAVHNHSLSNISHILYNSFLYLGGHNAVIELMRLGINCFLLVRKVRSCFHMSVFEICRPWKVLSKNQSVNCALAHEQPSLCLRNKLSSDPESTKLLEGTLPIPLYGLGLVLLRMSQLKRLQLCWFYKDTIWFLFLQRFSYLKWCLTDLNIFEKVTACGANSNSDFNKSNQ